MLETRPIAKQTLYAGGAFTFVFSAAMAGTAFMISGGFGGPDVHDGQRAEMVRYVNFGVPEAAAYPAPSQYTYVPPTQIHAQPVLYSSEYEYRPEPLPEYEPTEWDRAIDPALAEADEEQDGDAAPQLAQADAPTIPDAASNEPAAARDVDAASVSVVKPAPDEESLG